MKVVRRRKRIEEIGAQAVFVVHDEPEAVRRLLLADLELPFPLLVDLERAAYRAWGLRRGPLWRIGLDPKLWLQYAELLASGERLRGVGRDMLQLGGDFIVAPDGTLAYARAQQRDDRPPVGELIERLEDCSERGCG